LSRMSVCCPVRARVRRGRGAAGAEFRDGGIEHGFQCSRSPPRGAGGRYQHFRSYFFACAVRTTGAVVWLGQLASWRRKQRLASASPRITNATQVSAGDMQHACATRTARFCAGVDNRSGQLGSAQPAQCYSIQRQCSVVTDAIASWRVASHCVLRSSGQVSCPAEVAYYKWPIQRHLGYYRFCPPFPTPIRSLFDEGMTFLRGSAQRRSRLLGRLATATVGGVGPGARGHRSNRVGDLFSEFKRTTPFGPWRQRPRQLGDGTFTTATGAYKPETHPFRLAP